MKKTILTLIVLAISVFCVTCALAETKTLAFGYELELPEGVKITREEWTPENPLRIYVLHGTYHDGARSFRVLLGDWYYGFDHWELYVKEAPEMNISTTLSGGVSWRTWDSGIHVAVAFTGNGKISDGEHWHEEFDAFLNDAVAAGLRGGITEYDDVEESAEGETPSDEPRTAIVATRSSPLGMRSEPEGNDVILEIPKGETVTVLENGEWLLIEYDGQQGYVNGQYLEFDRLAVVNARDIEIFDEGWLLSYQDEELLKKRIAEFERNTNTVFVLYLVDYIEMDQSKMQKTLNSLIVDYLKSRGLSADKNRSAIGLCVNDTIGFAVTLGSGKAKTEVTDNQTRFSEVQNALFEELNHGHYLEGIMAYLDAAEKYLK